MISRERNLKQHAPKELVHPVGSDQGQFFNEENDNLSLQVKLSDPIEFDYLTPRLLRNQ